MFVITNIALILFVTSAINIIATYIGWQRRKTKGGLYFALGMMGATLWTLAGGFDYAAVPISLKIFFAKIESIGYHSALSLFTLFALSYAGHDDWLNKKWVKALFILIPTTNILLTWTNELHGLVWTGFTRSDAGENVVVFEHGPGFSVIVITGYAMILTLIVTLWMASRRGSELSRRQARLLFLASLIPVVSNLLYLFEFQGIEGVDWSTITFSISGVFFLLALYGTRLLDLAPIARHTIIEQMDDCVLVLDANHQAVDFNLAAQKIFGVNKQHIGSPIHLVMQGWPEIVNLLSPDSEGHPHPTIVHESEARVFDVNLTLLKDNRGQVYGKLMVFSDITKRYQAEKALESRLSEIHELHENLQQAQAQVVEQQRSLAVIDERQRMARDLHDSVNQSIHSLVMFSETLSATLEKNNVERATQISERIQESARQALKETRLLLYELQAAGPKRSVDLIQDLESRLSMVERRAGVRAEIIQEGSLEHYPQERHENLFWIAIEALNNALKHAEARKVQIVIRCSPKHIELEVTDNGKGFDTEKAHFGGLGLENMRARAELLGGSLTIESKPGKGTSVRFRAEA